MLNPDNLSMKIKVTPTINIKGVIISKIRVKSNQKNYNCTKYRNIMIQTLKVEKIGDSVGVKFSPELLEKLNLSEGDTLFLTETEHGIQISAYNPELAKAMAIYQEGSKKFNNALKELAK